MAKYVTISGTEDQDREEKSVVEISVEIKVCNVGSLDSKPRDRIACDTSVYTTVKVNTRLLLAASNQVITANK